MKSSRHLGLIATVTGASLTPEQLHQPADLEVIAARVNADPTSTWKAEVHPRFVNATLGDIASLCGVVDNPNLTPAPLKIYNASNSVRVAGSFDWREKMGDKCPGINVIKDQANCGSCWAFGSAEVMEDRACIQSGGSVHISLSEQDLVSCSSSFGNGCSGGQPLAAWRYFQTDGIVTGGPYGDTKYCYPYARAPCNHASAKGNPNYPDCPPDAGTVACSKTCVNGQSWQAAKVKNANAPYSLSGAASIEQELQKGPVTVIFDVMQDFPTYKSGVYKPSWPPVILGGHAVAIYGYGEENGQAYWLVKNSWNEGWGENGWFRIVKGVNAAYIESGLSSSQMPCAADVSVNSAFV